MTDVTRPRGVTAAAIVALIGSVGAAGSGIVILLAGVATNQPAVAEAMARQPAPPFSPLLIMINAAAIALRPGGFRGVMETYRGAASPQLLPPQFFDSMASFAMIVGLAFNLVLIALLISARGRYLRACTAPGLQG